MRNRQVTLYRAGALRDAPADGIVKEMRPGALAVSDGRILMAGAERSLRQGLSGFDVNEVDLGNNLVMPAMVNAHAHLNLTSIGFRPYRGDFIEWIMMVTIEVAAQDDAAITEAVTHGANLSKSAGVAWIGDIARTPLAIDVRCATGLGGTSFLELFGMVDPDDSFQRTLESASHIDSSFGLQPHAPYSAARLLYERAASTGKPLSTHLAETTAEIEFVRDANGPFVDLLRSFDKWDGSFEATELHPIDYLPLDKGQSWVIAHCNYINDEHIQLFAESRNVSIAYCPVASDYFQHTGHRYHDLLDAGANVCLGTDSIICQSAAEAQPLGILPQMRHLYRRDRTDPELLLRMATANGHRALNTGANGSLQSGQPAELIAVEFDPSDKTDPLIQILENDSPVKPVCGTILDEQATD